MNEVELLDSESERSLRDLSDHQKIKSSKIEGIRTVLVVLSSRMMAFDRSALTQKIAMVYPQAAVFFRTTQGKPMGVPSPAQVDLLIDLCGSKESQGFFYSRKLRKMGRITVGRKKGYQRVFAETEAFFNKDFLDREREAQRSVMALAGIPISQTGETPSDRGKVTPLELPPLKKM